MKLAGIIIFMIGVVVYLIGSNLDSKVDREIMDQIYMELEQSPQTNTPQLWDKLQAEKKVIKRAWRAIEITGILILFIGTYIHKVGKNKETKPYKKWI